MGGARRSSRAPTRGWLVVSLLLGFVSLASGGQAGKTAPLNDIVAVAVAGDGKAILLATPGLPAKGRLWRFRSLDTSDLPQPVRDVALSASGTKLLVQHGTGPGGVLDLTRQTRHNSPLQYVGAADVAYGGDASGAHRLPAQLFISLHDGVARVVDDAGAVQAGYPAVAARYAAISGDGVALYVRDDGTVTLCGEDAADRGACRELPTRIDTAAGVSARAVSVPGLPASPRFLVLAGLHDHVRLVDPEAGTSGPPVPRAEAGLRAALMLHGASAPDRDIGSAIAALMHESGDTWAAGGQRITAWRFFRVAPDEELYTPVLEFAPLETVFPSRFDMLEELAKGAQPHEGEAAGELLFDRYLRLDPEARRARCTVYVRTHSTPGSWMIEYWLYYPFDVGGLGSHPHDPEHIFVEVDKLGGTPARVIGAGHGYLAGNNVFRAERAGAYSVRLPLHAVIELGKHATAPDVDRDGAFTPGVDENEYEERAKIWGVRDVIGTINNQLLPYDITMSVRRRPEDRLALVSAPARFPGEPLAGAHLVCRLEPLTDAQPRPKQSFCRLSDWILLPPCHELTADCGKKHVTLHPDFLDMRTILKEWTFPSSFLRGSYGIGPGRGVHSIGLGYAMELDRLPGLSRVLPLPGRFAVNAFYWQRNREPEPDSNGTACPSNCERKSAVGWGMRYEQFLSNLFGIFGAAHFYVPPFHEAWFTFGPLIEAPIGKRSNVSVHPGLSFGLHDSPEFELRVSVGIWKPKSNQIGIRAGSDHRH